MYSQIKDLHPPNLVGFSLILDSLNELRDGNLGKLAKVSRILEGIWVVATVMSKLQLEIGLLAQLSDLK